MVFARFVFVVSFRCFHHAKQIFTLQRLSVVRTKRPQCGHIHVGRLHSQKCACDIVAFGHVVLIFQRPIFGVHIPRQPFVNVACSTRANQRRLVPFPGFENPQNFEVRREKMVDPYVRIFRSSNVRLLTPYIANGTMLHNRNRNRSVWPTSS